MTSRSLIERLKRKRFLGLEKYENSGAISWNWTLFEQLEGTLDIVEEGITSNLDKSFSDRFKGIGVVLIINTEEVISKLIPNELIAKPEQVLGRFFPNLNPKAYWYSINQTGDNMFLHLAKEETVYYTIQELGILQKQLIHVSLGKESIVSIAPFMEQGKHAIGNYELTLSSQGISEILSNTNPQQSFELAGLSLQKTSLFPFSAILQEIGTSKPTSNFEDQNSGYKANFKLAKKFQKVGQAALVFFFLLLLGNFLLFNHYFDKVESLNGEIVANKDQALAMAKDQEQLEALETQVRLIQQNGNSSASFYLDRIAAELPGSIQLTRFTYQPLITPPRQEKPLALDTEKLQMAGVSKNDSIYAEWLTDLEKLPWIRQVETLNLSLESKNQTRFDLQIFISDEQ